MCVYIYMHTYICIRTQTYIYIHIIQICVNNRDAESRNSLLLLSPFLTQRQSIAFFLCLVTCHHELCTLWTDMLLPVSLTLDSIDSNLKASLVESLPSVLEGHAAFHSCPRW